MNVKTLLLSTASKEELSTVLTRFPTGHPVYDKAHKEYMALTGDEP